jgi:hypothetical protein
MSFSKEEVELMDAVLTAMIRGDLHRTGLADHPELPRLMAKFRRMKLKIKEGKAS